MNTDSGQSILEISSWKGLCQQACQNQDMVEENRATPPSSSYFPWLLMKEYEGQRRYRNQMANQQAQGQRVGPPIRGTGWGLTNGRDKGARWPLSVGTLGKGANVELNSTQEATHASPLWRPPYHRGHQGFPEGTRARPGNPLYCRLKLGWQEILSSFLPTSRS